MLFGFVQKLFQSSSEFKLILPPSPFLILTIFQSSSEFKRGTQAEPKRQTLSIFQSSSEFKQIALQIYMVE